MIGRLFEAGADVFRINMSHTNHERMRELVTTIRGIGDCLARGYDRSGFFEVDTGEQRAWTVQLTESAEQPSQRTPPSSATNGMPPAGTAPPLVPPGAGNSFAPNATAPKPQRGPAQ